MPQFFQPRSNRRAVLTLSAIPILTGAVATSAWIGVRSPSFTGVRAAVEQPVPFSHLHHVGQLKLDCRYCHTTVEQTAFAGMPTTETCMQCHRHVWTALPALEPVRSSAATGVPLAWWRVHDLPDFSVFDHSIHVHKGIGCVSCHGRVDQMPVVHKTETLHMQWCLDCHRRPEDFVRPRDEVFNMAWTPPRDPLELIAIAERLNLKAIPETPSQLGSALVEKYQIRHATSCSRCHH